MGTRTKSIRQKQKAGQAYRFALGFLAIIAVGVVVGYMSKMTPATNILFLIISAEVTALLMYRPFFGVIAFFVLTLLQLSGPATLLQSVTINRFVGVVLVMVLLGITAQSKKLQFRTVGIQTYLLIAYFSIAVLSQALSADGLEFAGLKNTAITLSMYFLTINIIKTRRELTAIAWTVVACGLISTAYGLSFNPVTDGERMNSFFTNPNVFALVLYFAFYFSLFFLFNSNKISMRIFMLSSVVLLLYTIVLTASRGALLAVVTTTVILLLRTRKFTVPAGIAFAIIMILLMSSTKGTMKSRIVDIPLTINTEETMESSSKNRLYETKIALKMFLDNPILGVGYGRFIDVSSDEYSNEKRIWTGSDHNIIFSTMAEMGVLGLLVIVAIFYTGLKDFFKASSLLRKENDIYNADLLWAYGVTLAGFVVFLMTHGSGISRPLCLFLAVGTVSLNVLVPNDQSPVSKVPQEPEYGKVSSPSG
ncbi:MAG: O-antigen ligase family protein [bacterium]